MSLPLILVKDSTFKATTRAAANMAKNTSIVSNQTGKPLDLESTWKNPDEVWQA